MVVESFIRARSDLGMETRCSDCGAPGWGWGGCPGGLQSEIVSGRADLNRRPHGPEPCALEFVL